MSRTWDVVVFGATGFTGKLIAQYLDANAPQDLRFAIAGRNESKLTAVRQGLTRADVGLIVADAFDKDAVFAMCESTQVIISSAGPFTTYGDLVVEGCVSHQTDYVDITGETPWVRSLIDRYHAKAAEDGTRIVPMCGFDSMPSDLGAWMMARHVREAMGEGATQLRSSFTIKGGLSGGTAATMMLLSGKRESAKQLLNAYLLTPDGRRPQRTGPKIKRPKGPFFDDRAGRWLFPFVMAAANSQVVRRSEALFGLEDLGYGKSFHYEEFQATRSAAGAYGMTAGLVGAMGLMSNRVGRSIAGKVVPQPGEGPSETERETGITKARFDVTTDSGKQITGHCFYAGDPGYKATSMMVAEAGLGLALNRADLPSRGGILTPSTAFEDVLLQRLRAAGMSWEIEEGATPSE